jgi:uncharacterized damage-inducible protein DinB
MTEVQRILDQMDRGFSGDAWHGPPLMRLLEGLQAEDASKHPIHGAHSIWEIVHHIEAWNTIVHRRLAGKAVEVTKERDWPPVWEVNETAWKRALENLAESRARLRKSVEALQDTELNQIPAGTHESRYVTLHGIVQHDLYHAGQIAILKKALP